MSGGRSSSLCTLQQLKPEESPDNVRTLRLTLQNGLPERNDHLKQKPVGRAFAVVSSRPVNGSQSLDSELVKSTDGDEEIIKVYLKAKAQDKANHEWNVSQLKNEVRYIQEARTSLSKLRQDIHQTVGRQAENPGTSQNKVLLEKTNGVRPHANQWNGKTLAEQDDSPKEDIENIRETARKLFLKLQESEKRHQSDKKAFEVTLNHYQKEVEHTNASLKKAEDGLAQKEGEVEELQRLMYGMEKEHQDLLKKMKDGEKELEKLRALKEAPQQDRSVQLEKEVLTLREKIHHLDDMLKSQQRKVRQMIEQLQNSRFVIEEKDAIIQELQEKVSFLSAENLEMHDRIDHLLGNQAGHSSYASKTYSKPDLQNGLLTWVQHRGSNVDGTE
ncbi:tuftelin isoform X3 [Ambystoma mexicanum]|uniref:tuftelin isoform X3 n=1 Tax=Ambystoma mexicanum TaxID=8296 RepID=UPI0037E74915